MTEYTVSRRIFVWGFDGPSQIYDGRGVPQSNICTTDFKLTFGSVSIFFLLSCRRSVVLVIAITISLSIGQLIVEDRSENIIGGDIIGGYIIRGRLIS